MAGVNQTTYTQAAYQNVYTYDNAKKAEGRRSSKTEDAAKADQSAGAKETTETQKKVSVDGPGTFGNPKLSEEALEYYNDLKKRYGNLNFVLVSSDKKQQAEMMKGSFANANSLTVLIDTDKIEKMAADETYRAKYESIIANAASGLNQMKAKLGSTANNVKAYGMTVNKNGMASYFAVIDKSLAAQKKRIAKKAEEKAEAKKADAKKAEKEKAKERLEDKRKPEEADEDSVTITANSIEELMRRIEEYYQNEAFGRVRTEEENSVGHQVDYSI